MLFRSSGELQLLSYEGLELQYLRHFEEAMASIKTFRDERLAEAEAFG